MQIILAVILYGGFHSLLASLWAKRRIERATGETGRRVYRLLFNVLGLVTLAPVLLLPTWLPDRVLYRIPLPWAALTLLVQGLAGFGLLVGVLQTDALSFIGFRQLFQSPTSLTQAESQLVTQGFYRWVRHPLYTCGLLFIWLSPVMTQNWLILYICFSIYIVVGAILEERKLVQHYGQAYLDYRSKTPMFIPILELLLH